MTENVVGGGIHAGAAHLSRRRLGVIGTFVWDSIHDCDSTKAPVEEWGGITYALAALDAALPDGWEIVPIIQVGSDLAEQAQTFLTTLRHSAAGVSLAQVPQPNNRVSLHYHTSETRSEYLTGGVPGWEWERLQQRLHDIDALYINLISGMELDLDTMQRIRREFSGVIYCDLHSLMLAVSPDGLRTPRSLENVTEWMRCFDLLQVNEDEMRLLASDVDALAAMALKNGVRALMITLGPRGVLYFAVSSLEHLFDLDQTKNRGTGTTSDTIRTSLVPALPARDPDRTDPTGCGDVWGATYFARLLAGDKLGDALMAATFAAVKNVNYRGASSLASYLRGEITVK